MKKSVFALSLLFLLALGTSCTKTYSVSPLPAPTSTPTPNPLICTPTQTPGPPPSGIYWYSAQVKGITADNGVTVVNGIFAQVLMTVNGTAETTDTVSVGGPGGLSATIPYTNNVVMNGNSYAQYQALLPNAYQAGGNYSLTTATSIGTASATLTAPGNITIASDGSSAGWTNGGILNTVIVQQCQSDGGLFLGGLTPVTIYQTASCANEGTPFTLPLSDYYQPAFYTFTVNCQNMASAITGGTGYFKVSDDYERFMMKNEPPTRTPIVIPTATPVGTPFTDVFTLSPTTIEPPAQSVSISVTMPAMGLAEISVYNDSGSLTKILYIQQITMPITTVAYAALWDGTDDYGNPAPDGVYEVSFLEPQDWKLGLVLVIR